jgi:hypothetical protein
MFHIFERRAMVKIQEFDSTLEKMRDKVLQKLYEIRAGAARLPSYWSTVEQNKMRRQSLLDLCTETPNDPKSTPLWKTILTIAAKIRRTKRSLTNHSGDRHKKNEELRKLNLQLRAKLDLFEERHDSTIEPTQVFNDLDATGYTETREESYWRLIEDLYFHQNDLSRMKLFWNAEIGFWSEYSKRMAGIGAIYMCNQRARHAKSQLDYIQILIENFATLTHDFTGHIEQVRTGFRNLIHT